MEVDKGRTLTTAFVSMEEMYNQQRQKVAVESEVIVNAAVFTEMKANDEHKKLVELSRSLKDQFRNEIMLVQSLNIDLIKFFLQMKKWSIIHTLQLNCCKK